MYLCVLSHVWLSAAPMDQNPPCSFVHAISQAQYWSGLPFPSPGNLPNTGIESESLASPAMADRFFTTEPPWKPQLPSSCSVAQLCLTLATPWTVAHQASLSFTSSHLKIVMSKQSFLPGLEQVLSVNINYMMLKKYSKNWVGQALIPISLSTGP